MQFAINLAQLYLAVAPLVLPIDFDGPTLCDPPAIVQPTPDPISTEVAQVPTLESLTTPSSAKPLADAPAKASKCGPNGCGKNQSQPRGVRRFRIFWR